MAFPWTFKRTIKPNLLGLDFDNNLVVNYNDKVGAQRFLGCARKVATLTSAQILALNATPITVLAAPGAGYANILHRVVVHKPAGTAYAGIAAGEDLVFKYTNGSGQQVMSQIDMTGFADQTTAQCRAAFPIATTSTTSGDITPVANAVIVAQFTTGEITTGNSPFYVEMFYDTIRVAFTS